MKILQEFKEFALKGNILDMAIGIVIGGAFQKIITSLVEDIIMPFTALFTGSVDYSDWVIHISTAEIKIGSFLTSLISFFILALSVFLALKAVITINKRVEKMNKEVSNRIAKTLKLDNDEEQEKIKKD